MHCTNVHYYFLVWQKWRLSTICMLIHVLLKLISLNLLCVFNSLSSSLSISITWSFPLQTVFYSIALGDCNKSNHKLMHKSMCTHCDQSVSSQYNCIFHYSNSRRIRQEKKCPCSPNKSAMDISTPKIDMNHEHFTPDISAEGNQPWTFYPKHFSWGQSAMNISSQTFQLRVISHEHFTSNIISAVGILACAGLLGGSLQSANFVDVAACREEVWCLCQLAGWQFGTVCMQRSSLPSMSVCPVWQMADQPSCFSSLLVTSDCSASQSSALQSWKLLFIFSLSHSNLFSLTGKNISLYK